MKRFFPDVLYALGKKKALLQTVFDSVQGEKSCLFSVASRSALGHILGAGS
jgi:hypothetical protein